MGKGKEMDGDIFPPRFRPLLIEIVRLFVFVLNLLIPPLPPYLCSSALPYGPTAPQLYLYLYIFRDRIVHTHGRSVHIPPALQ